MSNFPVGYSHRPPRECVPWILSVLCAVAPSLPIQKYFANYKIWTVGIYFLRFACVCACVCAHVHVCFYTHLMNTLQHWLWTHTTSCFSVGCQYSLKTTQWSPFHYKTQRVHGNSYEMNYVLVKGRAELVQLQANISILINSWPWLASHHIMSGYHLNYHIFKCTWVFLQY